MAEPTMIGESDEFLRYLQTTADSEETQVFVVVSEEHERHMTYLHPPYRQTNTE